MVRKHNIRRRFSERLVFNIGKIEVFANANRSKSFISNYPNLAGKNHLNKNQSSKKSKTLYIV